MIRWKRALTQYRAVRHANFLTPPCGTVNETNWEPVRNVESFAEAKPPVFKKKRTIGGYEYDASVPVADRKSKGPFQFKKVEPSIFAEEVNLGAEIKRTGSAQPNLTRQHFMNTLLQNGRLLKAWIKLFVINTN